MVNITLNPIFDSLEIPRDLVFIRSCLGYDGKVNILFAESKYDCIEEKKIINFLKSSENDPEYRIWKKFKICPSSPQNYWLLILGDDTKIVKLLNQNINYTHGLQIDHDKYCFIYHTFDENFDKNLKITTDSGKILNEFSIGRGINDVQTNKNHELWVSYSDDGIYYGPSKNTLACSGLNCFDAFGNITYKYKNWPKIDECNSINVVSEEETLINIYSASVKSWYAFGKISQRKNKKIIEWEYSTRFLAYSENKVLVQRIHYKEKKEIKNYILLKINEKIEEMNSYEFINNEGKLLSCTHAQYDTLYFWESGKLYKISINELEKYL